MLTKGDTKEIIKRFKNGEVGVLPTDTIYGLHCLASESSAIDRIYELKQKPRSEKFIRLISSIDDIPFKLTEFEIEFAKKYWPGPVTLIFKGESFRLPHNDFLIGILEKTGPLVSTSANIHKDQSALSAKDAYETFGNDVDFYVDDGILENSASKIFMIEDDQFKKLR